MPVIQAWECPRSGLLFKFKSDYLVHLKGLARISIERKKHEKFLRERADFWAGFRASITDINQLKDAILANWEQFCRQAHYNENEKWGRRKEFNFSDYIQIDNIKINLKLVPKIRNSHHAPLNGGIRNWNGDSDKPTHYPGFYGKIEWTHENTQYTKKISDLPGKFFDGTGLFTGSGGGGSMGGSQELYLYLDDWPGLVESLYRLPFGELCHILNGNSKFTKIELVL